MRRDVTGETGRKQGEGKQEVDLPKAEEERRKKEKERDLLVHDNTNSIIQNTLPKNNRIQLRINLILIENRKNRHWVRS